ncbi:MAG: LytTR family transcriptional regulator DNA-binding domain-containing protein [Cyclobacteriaceae bacterium]|nr:LytTR family transcriptional regulator DNA-binding domain-containing protein [Cyclobacteriaceae bacterium]
MNGSNAVDSRVLTTDVGERPNRLKDLLNAPFPFYLNDDRKNAVLVVAISGFVTLFLYLFKTESELPFANELEWLHGSITLAVLSFNILVLPRLLPAWMDPVAWNVWKYIVLNLVHLLLIWILATIIEKIFFCPAEMAWTTIAVHASKQVLIKGIIPITLTTLFLRARLLQQNLEEAIRTNQELQKIQSLKRESVRGANPITLYSDTSESLTLNLPDLLYIEADDNYATVVWREQEVLQKKLLRVNLKNLESQLNNSFMLRCHRSYIVNINAIGAISGNTNGYKLKINGSDFSIPVSRPKGREVMEKISQLRNMMELS